MANQLWSDQKIIEAFEETNESLRVTDPFAVDMITGFAIGTIKCIRDEYEALVPDAETLSAIKKCMVRAAIKAGAWDEGELVQAWLNRLENT